MLNLCTCAVVLNDLTFLVLFISRNRNSLGKTNRLNLKHKLKYIHILSLRLKRCAGFCKYSCAVQELIGSYRERVKGTGQMGQVLPVWG